MATSTNGAKKKTVASGSNVDAVVLRAALSLLENVPLRPGIMSSEYVRLQFNGGKGLLKLSLCSEVLGCATIPCSGPTAWNFRVPRRILSGFLPASLLKQKDVVTFDVGKAGLIVKHGRRRATLFNADVEGYSDPPRDATVGLKISDDVRKALRTAAKFAPSDPASAHLACVRMDKRGVLTTNSYITFLARVKPTQDYTFPLQIPDMLADGLEVATNAKGCLLTGGHVTLYQPLHATFAEFPADAAFKLFEDARKLPVVATTSAPRLAEALARMDGLTGGAGRLDAIVAVSFDADKKRLTIRSSANEGRFEESLPAEVSKSVDLKLASQYVRMFAETCEGALTFKTAASAPYIFLTADSNQMIHATING